MSARNSASILAPTITHNQIEVTHHAVGVANYGFSGASRAGYSAGRWIKIPRHGCRTSRSWSLDTIVAAWAARASSRYLLSVGCRQSITEMAGSNHMVPETVDPAVPPAGPRR